MSLIREKCEDCVGIFTDKICLSCPNEYCTVNCEVLKSENQLYQVIQEYFETVKENGRLQSQLLEYQKVVIEKQETIDELKKQNEYLDGREKELLAEIHSLDCELYDLIHEPNPPLKFEEFKEGMWVWNNEQKKYLKIVDVIDYDEDFDEPAFLIVFEPNEYDCWVENRFYRKQVEE